MTVVEFDPFSTTYFDDPYETYRQLRDAARFLAAHGHPVIPVPPELHTGIDYAVHVIDPEGHCVQLYHEMENVGSAGRPLTATGVGKDADFSDEGMPVEADAEA